MHERECTAPADGGMVDRLWPWPIGLNAGQHQQPLCSRLCAPCVCKGSRFCCPQLSTPINKARVVRRVLSEGGVETLHCPGLLGVLVDPAQSRRYFVPWLASTGSQQPASAPGSGYQPLRHRPGVNETVVWDGGKRRSDRVLFRQGRSNI